MTKTRSSKGLNYNTFEMSTQYDKSKFQNALNFNRQKSNNNTR